MKDETTVPIFAAAFLILGVILIGAPLLLGHKPLQSSQPTEHGNGKMADIASFSPTNAGHDPGGAAADNVALATANNTAVNLMQSGKIQEAIDGLEPVVKANPQYALGRENLAVAYNNQALKQSDSPKAALDSLWRSFCLAPSLVHTRENIDDVVKVLKKDPKNFYDRQALGDAQMTEGCLYGAYAEYTAALKLRKDTTVQSKLEALEKQATQSGDDDVNGAFFVKMAMLSQQPASKAAPAASANDVDYGPYMARLQRSIKSHWSPPKRESSQRTQVQFAIAKDGTISKLRVIKSSGDAEEDKAGLEAINKMGKAPSLPDGSDQSVDIQFTFDYNVFSSDK